MFEAIKKELDTRGISVKKVYGLAPDGAPVVVGRKNGLLRQFLKENPHIANIQCSAHRVALVSEQAADSVPALKKFKGVVTQLKKKF